MWRAKAMFEFDLGDNDAKTDPRSPLKAMRDGAQSAAVDDRENWLSYQVEFLTGLYRLILQNGYHFHWNQLAQQADLILRDTMLVESLGNPALVARVCEFYVLAKNHWAQSQPDPQGEHRKLADELAQRRTAAKELCREAELEFVLGELGSACMLEDENRIARAWQEYTELAVHDMASQRHYRGSNLLGDFYFGRGDLAQANHYYQQTLAWLEPVEDCRAGRERSIWAWRMGKTQFELPSGQRDRGLIRACLQQLKQPIALRDVQIFDNGANEAQLDNLVKRLQGFLPR
jgi:hypothetical protein